MSIIIKDTLHPENESGTDIYPKTSTDQVVGYGQDANGKDFAIVDDTCKKPINIGTPTHVLGVEGGSSNQPISILIGNDRNNIPKRNVNGNIESLKDATNNNEYIRKGQFDKGLSEVSAPVVNITATSTATQGTISASDLQVLQGNKSAIIRFNNELYYFMDDEYKSGYLTYSHVGVDAGIQWVKSITITISSLSWVLTKSQVGGERSKIYKHYITIQSYSGGIYTNNQVTISLFNFSDNKINELNKLTVDLISNSIVTNVQSISTTAAGMSALFIPNFTLSYIRTIRYFKDDGTFEVFEITDEYKINDTVTIIEL